MSRSHSPARALTGIACTLAVLVSACGGGSSSSDEDEPTAAATGFEDGTGVEIVAAGFSAMKQADQFHLRGELVSDGAPLTFDVRSGDDGLCAGTMTSGRATTEFVATRNATFLKGNRAFWVESVGKDADDAMDYVGSRWARLEKSAEFAELCDIPTGLSRLGVDPDEIERLDDDGVQVSEVERFGGHPTVRVTAEDGDDKVTLVISTDEPHYILKLVSGVESDPGEIVFDFDKPVTIVVPGAGDIVDLRS